MRNNKFLKLSSLILWIALFYCVAEAQTSLFTYQGNLKEGGSTATGIYDFTFKLFSTPTGGQQIGAEFVVSDLQVSDGIFTVSLDFGAQPFSSAAATYLEIAVRPGTSTSSYTTLTPRSPITSSPYSIKSLNADTALNSTNAATANNSLQLGGIAANQFVVTNDPRMTDTRMPARRRSERDENQ